MPPEPDYSTDGIANRRYDTVTVNNTGSDTVSITKSVPDVAPNCRNIDADSDTFSVTKS